MERKLKGFTIIELMVVIAIIAVLASIGVPAALTWVRDAKVRDANEEARLLYSAVQDYLTELEIKNVDLKTGSTNDMILYSCSYDDTLKNYVDSSATKDKVASYGAFYSGADMNGAVKGKAIDFSDALTENFEGVWIAKINMDTYTVIEACWTSYVASPTTNNDPSWGIDFEDSSDQEEFYSQHGVVIGKFPL